jgi:predicted deacylase
MSLLKIKSKHKHKKPIVIDKTSFAPGESGTISLNVGRLPSDTRINIIAHVYRSKNPGPVILLLGGVHGDEINGVEIIRRLLDQNSLQNVNKGTIIAIPLLNVFGFINFSRDVPDGKDVNRSFPGSSNGSLASRVARTLTKKILPYVDLAMDFHTGGASRYNFPQVRYEKSNKLGAQMAKIFQAPFVLQKPLIPKSFRKTCSRMGIPAIVYEAGESIRLCGVSIEKGMDGILRVLNHLGMIDSSVPDEENVVHFAKSTWLRAPYSGMFIWTRQSGAKIKKGEQLGVIKDPFGTKSVQVFAKTDGHIVGHNNASVVNQGDALFHIGIESGKL